MPQTLIELPKSPLIDTNVLYEFLVWQFCEDAKIPLPDRASTYLFSDELRIAFNWYIERATPIYTSPQVIAEIHGLIQAKLGWHGGRLSQFWRFAKEKLTQLMLREDLVRVIQMNAEDLGAFGPIDSSILELAKRKGGIVVTEDGALRGRLTREEIPVLVCSEILTLWQQWNA